MKMSTKVITCENMKNTNMTNHNLFLNKMNIHLNMFDVLVLNWVIRKIDCTDIVTIHKSSLPKKGSIRRLRSQHASATAFATTLVST